MAYRRHHRHPNQPEPAVPAIHRETTGIVEMMYRMPFMWICILTAFHCSAQNPADIDQVKSLLEGQKIERAVEVVQNEGHKDLYVYGRRLAEKGHMDTALDWFVQLTLKYDNPEYYYGRAWVHWMRQEIGEARHCGEYIIENGAPKLILARAHYLLGLITYNDLEYETANFHADKCELYYRELGKNGGLYLANILRAAIAVRGQDFESGKRYIEIALEYNNKIRNPYPLGRAYELYSEMAFVSANYQEALDYAEKSKDEYFKADMQDNGWSLCARTGLCNALLGNFDASYDIAKEVEDYARENRQHKVLVYNHCTWIYMNRCRGLDYGDRLNEIKRWSDLKKSGRELSDLVDFVLTVKCQ